ncbi:hypothetical protein QZH41_014386 [Actinostola sp. cb2023]|nr:hypothetical protein QZH41_014386 [Actinostola sp. cb2023]
MSKAVARERYGVGRYRTDKPADKVPKEIGQIIEDVRGGKRYLRGRFLGKGGFAKCYELKDMSTDEIFAGKIVSKTLLVRPHQKEKMCMEIDIHKRIHHRHVVKFHHHFEDKDYLYIILELCPRRSLMEMHKRRGALTEPEVRYFMKHIIEGCQYLHHNQIIHRDLKLGNLFLNDNMELKLGDFGLATTIKEGERKKTLCGTPNYIAPEVLNKRGHSYEVDVWSLGCILYTLLVGKPPFETQSLKETYGRIKRNEYYIPSKVQHPAQLLIIKLLRPDPSTRPNMADLLEDEFFHGYTPSRLPVSCLTMLPKFASSSNLSIAAARKPLLELNAKDTGTAGASRKVDAYVKRKSLGIRVVGTESTILKPGEGDAEEVKKEEEEEKPKDYYLSTLLRQLTVCLDSNPHELPNRNLDEAEDPASTPVYWVSKWVDYSDKYGLGYALCDNSVGVLFNDQTRLILCEDGDNLQYIQKKGLETFYTMKGFPKHLEKKVKLINFFNNYMREHLLKAGGTPGMVQDGESSHVPFLRYWYRKDDGIVLHLSNGFLQINFFSDHAKIFLCPLMGAVTYIDEHKKMRTFPFKNLEKYGCSKAIYNRLTDAKSAIEELLVKLQEDNKDVGPGTVTTAAVKAH